MTREDVKNFLVNNKDKSKEEVLGNFASYCVVQNVTVDNIGKMIADLRSYPEWIWG